DGAGRAHLSADPGRPLGRRQDDHRARAAGAARRRRLLRLRHHAVPAPRRARRGGLPLRGRRRVPPHDRRGRADRVGGGARQPVRHAPAERARRGRPARISPPGHRRAGRAAAPREASAGGVRLRPPPVRARALGAAGGAGERGGGGAAAAAGERARRDPRGGVLRLRHRQRPPGPRGGRGGAHPPGRDAPGEPHPRAGGGDRADVRRDRRVPGHVPGAARL
ncbi:MAG: Guanylate kinase, partial [uncultured Gemmatimonadetes bacterium]